MAKWIKNFNQLATSQGRRQVLEILEAGLSAIETSAVIKAAVGLKGNVLKVKNSLFNLNQFEHLYIVGFGKAAGEATSALEQVLGPQKITAGLVIDTQISSSKTIQSFAGTHPLPSQQNVAAAQKILELSRRLGPKDLVLVVVSGGGSALLCYPQSEYKQGQVLYKKFLPTGGTIQELNTVRKHISQLKGGGLAKLLYPATIIGLIFSDIPGTHPEDVASGPTFFDKTTVQDAQAIIDKYNLGRFQLNPTPKQKKYFKKVQNFVLVSNNHALQAMASYSKKLGFEAEIFSSEVHLEPAELLPSLQKMSQPAKVVLAGGETRLQVSAQPGKGGRNTHLTLTALKYLKPGQVFAALASDGQDNTEAAGAIADFHSVNRMKKIDPQTYLKNFDSYNFFKKTGDLIFTGPTGANVADLILLLQN